jgi:outer membrane protein OmpA-like peptidoglycan-associated protein
VGYTGPEDMAKQLASKLSTGDMAAAAKMIAGEDAAQEAALKPVLEKLKALGFKVADPGQVQIIGQMGGATRLSIPLLKADGTPSSAPLELEMEKDAKMGVKITKLQLPKELESALAAMPASAGKPLVVVESQADALAVAHRFLQALISLDYEAARKLVNEEKVPPVKLAGLCMVFEEGKYKLNQDKPLLVTVATDSTSWVIANVHSSISKEITEFGLEMEKQPTGWRVMGLNLSKLLADNAKVSTMGDIPYTPLIQNPKGGDAIALYFEYDSTELLPRTRKQLDIVANILKASPGKKLKISGHTDALGSDNYNMDLSQKRADTVKQFFLGHGLPPTQVVTVGFGRSQPLSPNANPDGSDNPLGRSKNRRAEILLDF